MTAPSSPAPAPDLFGGDLSADAARRKSAAGLSQLMADIAACRGEIARKQAFAAELEARLRADWDPLEERIAGARLETFRILLGHARDAGLKRRDRETLLDALRACARELESEYGFDLGTEARGVLGEGPRAERSAVPERPAAEPGTGRSGASERQGPMGPGSEQGPRRTGMKRLRAEEKEAALAGDIRALYLMLARALHPDKEADPARRESKTAWMQKVTAAYGERDLAALLDILARNPLDAVGPYLSRAPAKTVQGFAKRLRRELDLLRRQSEAAGDYLPPAYARYVREGRVDEADYRRRLAEAKKTLKFLKERKEAYRFPEAVEDLIAALRQHPWDHLM